MKAEGLAQIVQIELGWDTDLTQQVLSQVKQLALDDQGTEIDDIVQARYRLFELAISWASRVRGLLAAFVSMPEARQCWLACRISCQTAPAARLQCMNTSRHYRITCGGLV